MGLFVYTGKTSYYLYEKSIKILNITMIIITAIITAIITVIITIII